MRAVQTNALANALANAPRHGRGSGQEAVALTDLPHREKG